MNPFSARHAETVAAWGERRLITALPSWLGSANPPPPAGIGDDCAVLPSPAGPSLLVTTDPVIHGRHFDDALPPAAVGAKLLKRNLSDIAAMGGTPVAAVVSLALPGRTRIAWLRGFYRGLAATAARHRVAVVGGDIAQSPTDLAAHLTLLGRHAPRTRVLTRTGASAGDTIAVSGPLGGSILGHHWRFEPRLAEGRWLARRRETTALMDISDGLAKDLGSLLPAGHVAVIDSVLLDATISTSARRLARTTGRPPWQHAAADGEDYELLFTLRRGTDLRRFATAWQRAFRRPFLPIGVIAAGDARPGPAYATPIRCAAGLRDWSGLSGYEHLR